jgi:hypothetical protein
VSFYVVFGRLLGVLGGVNVVSMGKMGVMCCSFVVTFLMMLGGFAVMTRSVLVVLRCLEVMLCGFV